MRYTHSLKNYGNQLRKDPCGQARLRIVGYAKSLLKRVFKITPKENNLVIIEWNYQQNSAEHLLVINSHCLRDIA